MVRDLPPELKSIVLQNLYYDKLTLAACSTLSRAWQYPSQRLLFRSIILRAWHLPTKPHSLYPQVQVPDYGAFLEALPAHLLGAVCDLEMSGTSLPYCKDDLDDLEEFYVYEDYEDDAAEGEEFARQGISWITLEGDTLLRIVQALPRLKTLNLSNFVYRPVNAPSTSLVKLEKIILSSFGTRGSDDVLRSFDVFGADKVIAHTFHCPMDEELVPVHAPAGLASLTALDMGGEDDALRLLQALQQRPPPLTLFTLYARTEEEFHALPSLLEALSPSLTRFFLDTYECFNTAAVPCAIMGQRCLVAMRSLDLSILAKLAHFELRVRLGIADHYTEDTMRAMASLISTLPSSIRHITLHLDLSSLACEPIDGEEIISKAEAINQVEALQWPVLEQALHDHGKLECVELIVMSSDPYPFYLEIPMSQRDQLDRIFSHKLAALKDILLVKYHTLPRSSIWEMS